MTHDIVPASEAIDAGRVGGKAAALARLSRLGFDVPPFFVVDTKDSNGAAPSAETLASSLGRLGSGPYAVRSSGREEDGNDASHAGQFLSILNVAHEDVEAAVSRVAQSGLSDSLAAYRNSHGLDGDGGAPAVIVQRMVKARAAGVAFSADPVSGRRDRIVISATQGLADQLVGGEVDGDQYVLESSAGTVLERPESDGVLNDKDIDAIRQLALRVEQTSGAPQDIEWALEGDRLFLIQARPITTPLRAPPIADETLTIFDNSNIVESYPGLVTPLTFSFAQYAYARVYHAFLTICGVNDDTIRAHRAALDNMLGRIEGRVYYNLINWYRLLALLPGFRISRSHMETMMGVAEALPAEIADRLAPPRAKGIAAMGEWLRVARMGAALTWEAIRLHRTIAKFYQRLNTALKGGAKPVNSMSLIELADEYRRLEALLLDRWDAPLINDFLCMIAFGSSRKLAEKWLGADGLSLHNDIMIGQGDIISAEPPRRIARMAEIAAGDPALIDALARGDREAVRSNPQLEAAVSDYINKFGDRCIEELKLESITLDVDGRPLLASIAAAAANKPASTRARPAPTGMQQLDRLLAGRPAKRVALRGLMSWAKARVRDRENLRFERTRIFGHARRVFIAMGRQLCAIDRLDADRDIFLLTVPEVLGAIEGFGIDRDLKAIVEVRRREAEREATCPHPGERIAMHGAIIARSSNELPAPVTQASHELKGTGCSAGLVRAKARVVRDPANEKLERGEILVAQHTDPGWIALFANASAIIVERGSLLSHSAIVARELGIPCVVGAKNAMTWLETGELIEVDGATGLVRKVQ
jgi:pyruvate,water dikinase